MHSRWKKPLFFATIIILVALSIFLFKKFVSQPHIFGRSRRQPPTSEKFTGQPNIILISIDALRADRLHCYGYPKDVSPNIDAFAEDSAQFTHCYSQATWTYPSHASMLTGLFPPLHGLSTEKRRVPSDLGTIMKTLKDSGYTTIGITDGAWMGSHFGWQDHFDHFDEHKRFETWDDRKNASPGIFESRIDAFLKIQDHVSEPYFAFIHTYEVHDWMYNDERNEIYVDPEYRGPLWRDPYKMTMGLIDKDITPDQADLKYIKARYDAAIFNMDKAFGTLISSLKKKGLYERSIIILTSDHGEAFGEKELFGHGRTPYNGLNRVPLIIEDGTHHGVYSYPVALTDIPVTIATIAGSDRDFEGRNIFDSKSRVIMTDTNSGSALILGDLKYLFLGKRIVAYRLDDLDEKVNVLVPDEVVEQPLTKEAARELKALGYLQ